MVYRTPIERACWMSVTRNGPRFVYAWTVNSQSNQKLYLRVGVNGMIADPDGISRFPGTLSEAEFSARFRLARRSDNPFLPPNSAYGLAVRTSDIDMAGTDANVEFTLTGANGSAQVAVDTHYNGRMERNSVNFVVLPSRDLGILQSITVQRDNRGNAPDWHLKSITVQSYRYGGQRDASFDCWIDTTGKFTRPFA